MQTTKLKTYTSIFHLFFLYIEIDRFRHHSFSFIFSLSFLLFLSPFSWSFFHFCVLPIQGVSLVFLFVSLPHIPHLNNTFIFLFYMFVHTISQESRCTCKTNTFFNFYTCFFFILCIFR